MSADEQVLPARTGVALRLDTGDRLRVVNTHGSQVVDLWAMAADDVLESIAIGAQIGGARALTGPV